MNNYLEISIKELWIWMYLCKVHLCINLGYCSPIFLSRRYFNYEHKCEFYFQNNKICGINILNTIIFKIYQIV